MSGSVFFDWPLAARAGKAGLPVRRHLWTDRWLQYYNGLWWTRTGSGAPHVVRAEDFGYEEFLAQDWTNLPASCVTDALAATGQTCPEPFNPSDPGRFTAEDGSGGSGSGSGSGSVGPAGPPGPPYALGVMGGGGGGGRSTRKKPDRTSITWPTLSLTMDDMTDPSPCYPGSGEGTGMKKASYGGQVSLSTTEDTEPGKGAAGTYFVSVRHGHKVLWSSTIIPGQTKDYGPVEVGPGLPGISQFTLEARAWIINSGDITASQAKTMQPWCEYAFQFECALQYCHQGVGWVTVRSPSNAILYEGCPEQGLLGMGNTTIAVGTSVTVQYSNTDGPCPGGHYCNAAVFDVRLVNGSSSVLLGTADLNNADDGGFGDYGGDRGPFTFTVTQGHLDALTSP